MFYKFLILALVISSCSSSCKSKVKINDLVLYYADEANFPYCQHINNCLALDQNSIKIMFGQNRNFLDGETSYMDCFYIYKITEIMGEDQVIEFIKTFSSDELVTFRNKLEVGLDYKPNEVNRLLDHFPKIHHYFLEKQLDPNSALNPNILNEQAK